MLSKNFEVGDLVWAKMKGFPPWPGKIIDPPSDTKSPRKKEHHYVYFFGSNNHAWILDENIVLHSEQMLMKQNAKKKSAVLKNAIESIIHFSKIGKNKKSSIENGIFETDLEKDISKITSSEDPVLVDKPESEGKLLKAQQNKKKIMNKTPLKRPSPLSAFKSFKRRYSSLSKDEALDDSLSFSPSKSSCSEQSLASLENDINSKVQLIDRYMPATLKKIGFLGLSPMNRGIVNHLLMSGHSVSVWNKSLETYDYIRANASKPTKCATPADVVKNSDIIFCCAADSDSAKFIVFDKNGVLSALEECGIGKGYVEMTTFDPSSSQDFAEVIKRTGAKYLAAPFNGSRKDIDDGAVCVFAAGDHSLFLDCESCFNAVAKSVYFISTEVGDASKMNLISNGCYGAAYATLAEAIALNERMKIPKSAFLEIINGGLDCPGLTVKTDAIASRKFSTDLPLRHVQRDIFLSLFMGSEVDSFLPITAAANEVYKHAKLLRYSDYDVSAVYQGIKY